MEVPSVLEEAMDMGTIEDLVMEGGEILEVQEGRVVEVVVDWMSCTQSLCKAVQGFKDMCYIPLDKQEWVFSQAMSGWVRNIPVDLEVATCEEIWQLVVQTAQAKTGARDAAVKVALLGMSPDCRTFTKIDSSNVSRGHNYRLHGEANPERPPRDDHLTLRPPCSMGLFCMQILRTFNLENGLCSLMWGKHGHTDSSQVADET